MQYREVLYSNYHSTQSGRASGTDAASLFKREARQFGREILPLLQHLDKSAVIFDMGCGSGSLLHVLQQAGYTGAYGMDISPEQVAMAASMGVSSVTEGDALAYVAGVEQQFDVLLGMDIIEHFTKNELTTLLQHIHKSLKPGGFAVFRTPNLDAPLATVFANGDFTHENYLNASSAQQVCMACGFNSVSVSPGVMFIENPAKELLRKLLWAGLKLRMKLWLLATARSSSNILFSPNMIIVARKNSD